MLVLELWTLHERETEREREREREKEMQRLQMQFDRDLTKAKVEATEKLKYSPEADFHVDCDEILKI